MSAEIPMTSKLAAYLVTISSFTSAVGAFILSADAIPFGLSAYDWGLSLVWVGTIANFAVVAIRRDLIPGISTGVGTEPASGHSVTTTVEQTETVIE